jgi:Ca2+-binding EF-hand superfamily protein
MSIESIGSSYSYLDLSRKTYQKDGLDLEAQAGKIFQKLDTDASGSLTFAEASMPEEIFSQADENQDGVIDQQENITALMNLLLKDRPEKAWSGAGAPGMQDVSEMAGRIIEDEDADGDGALSLEEISMPDDLFSRIDKDQDGVIDKDEITADLESRFSAAQSAGTAASSSSEAKASSKTDSTSSVEIIGNGIDDDGDGQIDENDASAVYGSNYSESSYNGDNLDILA